MLKRMRMALFISQLRAPIHHSIIRPRTLLRTHQFTSSIVIKKPPGSKDCSKDAIVISICQSISKGLNWDSLSKKFGSFHFTESLIRKVLLHLKQPINAKLALKFFHWSAHHMHSPHGVSNYCIAIHILVKARLFKDAKALLESILAKPFNGVEGSRNDHSRMFDVFDSLIDCYGITDSMPFAFDLFMQTCAKLRMIDDAVDACKILYENGFGLSVISYNSLLHVMQKSEKTFLVWSLYEHMIEKRVFPNEVTYRIMVSALSKEGRLKRVLDMLERILGKRCSSPGVVVNACLVFGMIEEGRMEDGLLLLKWMMLKNMVIDTVAFSLCVVAKVKMRKVDAAWEVYEEMCKRGFEGNSFVSTSFIWAYCKEGKIEEAIRLIQEMENSAMKPYDETFNHLIEGCSGGGYLEEGVKYCERMIKMGLLPSCFVFNKMVEKLCSNGETKRADDVLTLLLEKGFVPDEATYSHLAAGYMALGKSESILKLYYEMEHKSILPSSSFFGALITSLCRNGRVREADEYLILLKNKSLSLPFLAYETFIRSYLERDNRTRAQQLQEDIVGKGLKAG